MLLVKNKNPETDHDCKAILKVLSTSCIISIKMTSYRYCNVEVIMTYNKSEWIPQTFDECKI